MITRNERTKQFLCDRSIRGRLVAMMQLILAGFNPAAFMENQEYKVLVKALRLKEFGRCPACDGAVTVWNDRMKKTKEAHCEWCGWKASVPETDLVAANHPDDVLIALCEPRAGG